MNKPSSLNSWIHREKKNPVHNFSYLRSPPSTSNNARSRLGLLCSASVCPLPIINPPFNIRAAQICLDLRAVAHVTRPPTYNRRRLARMKDKCRETCTNLWRMHGHWRSRWLITGGIHSFSGNQSQRMLGNAKKNGIRRGQNSFEWTHAEGMYVHEFFKAEQCVKVLHIQSERAKERRQRMFVD